eukprot:9306602-Lingulodinium_polyedra.AAC.1
MLRWWGRPEPAGAGSPRAAGHRGGPGSRSPTAGVRWAGGRAPGRRNRDGRCGGCLAKAQAPARCRTEVAKGPM